ncbi:hypothetical protein NHX12_001680 [Muraenolepis orangiensis]|uniref:C-type lectin domain-containing protein n=1 Tax=Muraenolepis orangiensis TaxID=630683 RepID=A0A9Q0IF69_9TELE|nr:hypothetical protein NHX12_001680 [Muraenolepis orangiensis]
MEDELHYSALVFGATNVSPCDDTAIITKDVMSKEPNGGHDQIRSDRSKRLALVAVCLGIISLLLLSTIVYLLLHIRDDMLERRVEDLERRVEDLKRERDALNWTLNVITGMDNFEVNKYCPQKRCEPCRKNWVMFGSSCYFFSYEWKSWSESQGFCRDSQAQLVIIETQAEQEFVANNTQTYSTDRGYWMGLSLKTDRWTWVDGSKLVTTYWEDDSPTSGAVCALSLKRVDRLASWRSARCYINNRWICESQALMKTV